jgi:hypothetical protein
MIIGIAGKKGSGKNTLASYIKAQFEGDFIVKEWAFADSLKISAARALDFKGTNEECIEFCNQLKDHGQISVAEKYHMADWKISGREFLQLYGTEAHREIFGTNFWVNYLLGKIYSDEDGMLIQEGNNKPRFDLITDVRFPNEAEAIRMCEGKVLQIRRKETDKNDDLHTSEIPLDPSLCDAIVYNDFSLDELRRSAINTVKEICRDYIATHTSQKVPYA